MTQRRFDPFQDELNALPYVEGPPPQTVTAQVANLYLEAVPAEGDQTVTAQIAVLTLTAAPGSASAPKDAQTASLSLSAVAGVASVGPVTVTAQVATLRLETTHAEPALLPRIVFDGEVIVTIYSAQQSATGSGFGTYADGERPRYKVILVDVNGVGVAALDNAAIVDIEWSLNEPETFTFLMPTLDPFALEIEVPGTEVQVWRGDQLLVWGVAIRSRADMEVTEYQCRGLGWYLEKRVVGRAEQNYVANGSFDEGLNDWWVLYAPTEPAANQNPAFWDVEASADISLTGTSGRSLKMSGTDGLIFGVSAFSLFDYTVDPSVNPDGVVWTASAWVYIPSAGWVDERVCAYNWAGDSGAIGLTIRRMSPTLLEDSAPEGIVVPKLFETQLAPLSEGLPRDEWVRLECSLTAPADLVARTDLIQVGLHMPIGTVYWDEVSCTRNERLAFRSEEQATIVETLVLHAQDAAFGKSDLNIDTSCPASGVVRSRTYEYFNHDIIADTVREFTELWHGLDWSVECTATTRTFTTHYPMRGTRRPAQALVLGKNIAEISYHSDGEKVANRVIMMADTGASGSSREEVYATDTTGFASGLVLEQAVNALKDSSLTTLGDQAERSLRQYRVPVNIPTVTTFEGRGSELLGYVTVGDVVSAVADHGTLSLSGEFRIVGMRLDPASETLALTLNPFEEWNDPTRDWGVTV